MRVPDEDQLPFFWKLAGRLVEYRELLEVLVERPGLVVVSADPWSGTSSMIHAVAAQLGEPCIRVDARACGTALDLGLAIADEAVARLERAAAPWWIGSAPSPSAAGLRLARRLTVEGIDYEGVRQGTGPWDRRLVDAVEIARTLATRPITLMVDHAGLLTSALSATEARDLLGTLRTLRQRHGDVDLVLVEHPEGPAAKALVDPGHPLYRAGHQMRFRRPEPIRFALDLEGSVHPEGIEPEALSAAAELVDGVPALAWRVLDLGTRGETVEERARDGWTKLRGVSAPAVTRQWDLLRRVHPLAQAVVAAIASGLGPHAVPANSKSVSDALRRLRELGVTWQPAPRTWALADPLLAEWTHRHLPPWVGHRRRLVR